MGGGGSQYSTVGGDQEVTLRWADYIETQLNTAIGLSSSTRKDIIDDSPYADYEFISAYDSFFSLGLTLSTFPSMYANFGRYMSGIDIDSLFTDGFAKKMADTDEVVETKLSIVNDSIDQMQEGKILARNLNATNSSTFIMAQANIERNKIVKTAEMSLSIKYSLIPGIVSAWIKELSWDKALVTKYAESLRDYYLCRINADDFGYKKESDNLLWPIIVLDFERTMLSAMSGTMAPRVATKKERSGLSKVLLVLSYTVTGAQWGSQINAGYGTLIGAIIGFVVGLAIVLLE